MITRFLVLSIVAFAARIALASEPAGPGEVRNELSRQYARIGEAYKKRNVRIYERLLSKDFTRKELSGQLTNRREELSTFKSTVSKLKKVRKSEFKIEKLDVQGKHATVRVRAILDAMAIDDEGLFGPKGGICHMKGGDAHAIDKWLKTTSGWLLKHSETL